MFVYIITANVLKLNWQSIIISKGRSSFCLSIF